MSRDKSVWFAEEILLDAKLINFQLETGEWDAVEEMLKAEAQLSRDAETGRLRPKKASEYTLRLIAEVLHIMRLDIEQSSYNLATLGVAEQCLRLIRSCAASGTKMQTYITKDLSILDAMLVISSEFQQPSGELVSEEVLKKFENCMIVLIQTLGNLVVNNPFNQIIIWDKFESVILNCLVGQNDKIASAAAMIIYNILLSQPNVLPDDVALLNSLSFMYHNGNTEYPHLIIEYLIGVENAYIEKLYSKLEPECRLLVLNLAHNILSSLESQDINVSVNFVRFMALEFKMKSDLILKTVDKYVNSIEPQEVVFLLDILATASSMEAYMECLQNDTSLFINCSFLLQAIHKLGQESNNFFSSLNKLYANTGKKLIPDLIQEQPKQIDQIPLAKNDSTENILSCNETISECTESESSEQYFECTEMPSMLEKAEPINTVEELQQTLKFIEATIPDTKPPKAPVKAHTDPPKAKIDTSVTTVAIIKENVSFNTKENVEGSRASSIGHEFAKPINMFETKGSQSLPPSRKISLEHKIDMEDIEPPLILDSNSPSGSIKTITEVIPAALSKTDFKADSTEASQPASNNSPSDPTTDITVKNYAKTEVKPSASQVSPPLSDNSQENDSSKKQSPDQPREPKRSQNLSTDFDLSEQLQRILGTGREDKKSDHKEVKIVEEPTAMPTVKISSPDGQKNRLGAIDMSRPKVKQTLVHSVEQHVAFGFKGTLVRVIANLCWKHQINKKQVRELGMIPILLDCCNIDERNPLIMQWVIFAIRNICENCPENQEVIAKTTLQRAINNDLLKEMGLTLHADSQNNTIKVAPMKVQ